MFFFIDFARLVYNLGETGDFFTDFARIVTA